eukprot:TRINITY_DN25936_c0_g1_i1.p3 TRINITY_DN25936_c0_g1~~TRINITY_DN25936_c0_g1_i1.p3  ORF type:complete len:107 (+),score=35.87 TRINITY_DN25936_c0_g1_i1:446-766(+)
MFADDDIDAIVGDVSSGSSKSKGKPEKSKKKATSFLDEDDEAPMFKEEDEEIKFDDDAGADLFASGKGKKDDFDDDLTFDEPKDKKEIGRAVQQECRDRSRMPSSA